MKNIIIDQIGETKIPQNNDKFFSIKKYDKWRYSLEIKFETVENLNYLNLFFILKSFVLNKEYPPYAICTSFTKENKHIISQKESITWFKNIDYYDFIDWINFKILHDSKYEPTENFYAIILIFSKDFIIVKEKENKIEDILSKIKPIYPWTPEWLNNFQNQIEKIKILEEEIKFYKSIFKK